jgi:uroporphyrinogen decarboxylase
MNVACDRINHISPFEQAERTALAPLELESRDRFLRACFGRPVDHPPIWMMRQAGRSLPEYRKLRERYSFLELVQTPELAAEVTLQPVRRFGFDAAIIFSDILVVPEAMGVGYRFRDTGGVVLDRSIQTKADVARLSVGGATEKLAYVAEALRLVRQTLNGKTALLGFAGSPWTLANYLLDGGSAQEHRRALALFHEDWALFEELCDKLTQAVIAFLRLQIAAGADAVQIFDSCAGLLPPDLYKAASELWIREVIAALGGKVPVIVYAKGCREWNSLERTGAQVISVDHHTTLAEARARLTRKVSLQGNLDPAHLLLESREQVEKHVRALLHEMEGENGYILNLGHGVPPNARLENIQAVADTVRSWTLLPQAL